MLTSWLHVEADASYQRLPVDFGTRDAYVGAMKGRLLSDLPGARVVDISHDIAPGDVEAGAPPRRLWHPEGVPGRHRQRVLGVQPQVVAVGHDAVGGAPGQLLEPAQARRQQGGVAAELVDQKAGDQRLIGRLEHGDGAEEVRQQEKELGFQFDYIVVCSVTGSTQAGMVVGFAADGRARKVIGIDASAKPEKTHAQILRIAQNTAKLVELGQEITAEDVVLDTRYGGPEYGLPNEGTLEAIRLCARQEGMLTDPVYEGKSMHGMIDRVRRGEFPEGSRVLYAHLGGVPALNAYSFLFRNG